MTGTRCMRTLDGALAGLIATAAMTLAMEFMHRRLPPAQRYPLPPRQITMNVAARVGAKGLQTEARRTAATLIAHFGFGALAGALYPHVAADRRLAAPLRGTLWGLAVWAGSYLGWIPALRILPAATRHPAARNLLMLGAHVVWGATLGWMAQRRPVRRGGLHHARPSPSRHALLTAPADPSTLRPCP